MAIQNEPSRISTPFADAGTKNVIPETMAQPSATAAASWQAGFPTVCSLPLSAGGIPPARNDFNGLFNQMTQTERFLQDGGIFSWSADTDYGANRLVLGSDGKLYWSAAQSGPNTGAGAVDPTTDSGAYWGQLPVTATEAAEAAYSSVAGGFVPWSNNEDYAVSQIVLGSDGLVYMAKAASGPGTTAGAKDPTADTAHAYWVSPRVQTMPNDDSSKSVVNSEWVNYWYTNRLLPTQLFVDGVNGSDSNDGFTSQTPKKTINAALSLLRSAYYLKREQHFIAIKSADYSSEYITGVTGVQVGLEFLDSGSTVGSVYVSRNQVIQFGGTFTTSKPLFASGGGIIILGFANKDLSITFDNVNDVAILRTSAGGIIQSLWESNSISISLTGTCVLSTGVIAVETNSSMTLQFKSGGRISWSGTATGLKYMVDALSSVTGTGPSSNIPGTSTNVNSLGFVSA